MRLLRNISVLLLATLTLFSCLEDPTTLPIIEAKVVAASFEGQVGEVKINDYTRTVSVVLDETTDLSAVKVEGVEISDRASFAEALPEVLDLRKPYKFVLKTYQDYEWSIVASQPISRYVKIAHEAAEAQIDPKDRVATVSIINHYGLQNVIFEDMKLEAEGSRVVSTTGMVAENFEMKEETLACEFPMTLSCVVARTFNVELPSGEEVVWTVKVLTKAVAQEIAFVNAWAYHADIRATYPGVGEPEIWWREAQAEEWNVIPFEDLNIAGPNVTIRLDNLSAGTAYVVKIVIGEVESEEYEFETETPQVLPNMGFDDWTQEGKTWYPFVPSYLDKYKDKSSVWDTWDTANKGTAGFIGSISTPDTENAISGTCVRMESKNAIIEFSGGNIYLGRFDKISGIGAELDWGVPFTSRPAKLRGWYNYTPAVINTVAPGYEHLKGEMDQCQIQIFLTDWDQPFHINTAKNIRVDFEGDPHIIAWTNFVTGEPTNGWKQFEFDIEYRDLERKPKYITITCCSSYLADFFVGAIGSVLYVDELELVYE